MKIKPTKGQDSIQKDTADFSIWPGIKKTWDPVPALILDW